MNYIQQMMSGRRVAAIVSIANRRSNTISPVQFQADRRCYRTYVDGSEWVKASLAEDCLGLHWKAFHTLALFTCFGFGCPAEAVVHWVAQHKGISFSECVSKLVNHPGAQRRDGGPYLLGHQEGTKRGFSVHFREQRSLWLDFSCTKFGSYRAYLLD